MKTYGSVQIPEPKLSLLLFGDTHISWLWLLVRLYAGWQWFQAGWGKITSSAWVGSQAGTALRGFLNGTLQKTGGAHPDVSGWYAAFVTNVVLPNVTIFSYIIACGEMLVAVGLILGAFTGIAAFFGAFMNLNYLFAGTLSINPLLLVIQLLLVLAWRNAGWWGLDRWLLPLLGVHWEPGKAFHVEQVPHT